MHSAHQGAEMHLGLSCLYPVRPQLLLHLRGGGNCAAGGGGSGGGSGRWQGVRGRLHVSPAQIHATSPVEEQMLCLSGNLPTQLAACLACREKARAASTSKSPENLL